MDQERFPQLRFINRRVTEKSPVYGGSADAMGISDLVATLILGECRQVLEVDRVTLQAIRANSSARADMSLCTAPFFSIMI